MMKQRITVEQLNGLSDVQKERLREWWKPQEGDQAFCENYGVVTVHINVEHEEFNPIWISCGFNLIANNPLPLLSIGQMVQLLDDDRQSDVPVPISQILPNYHLHYTDSLCDVLWESVKEILKDTPTP